MGIAADGLESARAAKPTTSTPSTAISRRCSASTSTLNAGETVAIIGANGAGKSTLLEIASPACCARRPTRCGFDGRDIGALPAYAVVTRGIALVPEGRRLFPSLSVEENLLIGGYGRRAGGRGISPRSIDCFPCCANAGTTPSTTLSGGQQQMVAIGRALMSNPRILLCDEISLGLAPIVIRDIYARAADIKTRRHQRRAGRAGS